MEAVTPWLVPLSDVDGCSEPIVGGKAAKLARLAEAGCRVPEGFCLTVAAYELFLRDRGIEDAIRMELGRKSFDGMRWEEMWDAALRIRSVFLAHRLPTPLREALHSALVSLGDAGPFAVRSSAVGEDSGDASFAGLHESVTDVAEAGIEKAVILVWASLWSDAALLYRRELRLDPAASRMAVLVQSMVHADRSGVAFGEDPRGGRRDHAIIEAVPGPCRLLVDGASDPDRWEIHRPSRKVVSWHAGEREDTGAEPEPEPLLERADLDAILDAVQRVEELLRLPPDLEWTGRAESLTMLQARPITTTKPDEDTERQRSLSLRPGDVRLRELREIVAERLIPELEAEGRRLGDEPLERLDDVRLADAIEQRFAALERWKKIYWDVFIPFAHGVRRLATYYNDFVRPEDPYEFVGLLQDQPLLAAERNHAMDKLAVQVAGNAALRARLQATLESAGLEPPWSWVREQLVGVSGGERFLRDFEDLNREFFDIAYDRTRLQEDPGPLLQNVLELARKNHPDGSSPRPRTPGELEQRLWTAVGEERFEEAREMVAIGRLSWKLRDDDNLLVARIESQLLRAVHLGVRRLREAGKISGESPGGVEDVPAVTLALRDRSSDPVKLKTRRDAKRSTSPCGTGEAPRQLVGQPASPGLASGPVRVIRGRSDLGRFRQGEVLVCDAIQPTMTHLAMLAAAIVERRGGMLIHGAIIARELGIPCVNGIRAAAALLREGDIVTVDGYLGIVTVGPPELDLELLS